MRHRLARLLGALALGWLTGPAWAADPPAAPAAAERSSLQTQATIPARGPATTAVGEMPAAVCSQPPPVVFYGFEPAHGLTTFGGHDDIASLMWEGYVGHVGSWDMGGCGQGYTPDAGR